MKVLLSFIIPLLLLTACRTSSTAIIGSWSRDDFNSKAYDHLMIAALTDTANFQPSVERELALSLGKKDVNTTQSINVFPRTFLGPKKHKEREELMEEVKEKGTDAILTVSIIDEETETRYVPGTTYYNPAPIYGYYNNFWGYYNHWTPRVQTAGYYTESKYYFIETNLYDAATEELMWSAQSKAYDPETMKTFTKDYAEEIVEKLASEGWIASQ